MQAREDIKRKNHGMAAKPLDTLEQILYLCPPAVLASVGETSGQRGRRWSSGRITKTTWRLQGMIKAF